MAMYSWLCTKRPEMFWYSGFSRMRAGGDLVGRVAEHEVVPRLLGVEHGRPQLAARAHAGLLERLGGHRLLDVAEALEPQRVGQPPGGVDGEHEHLAAERRGGHRRGRGRGGRLAHAARSRSR